MAVDGFAARASGLVLAQLDADAARRSYASAGPPTSGRWHIPQGTRPLAPASSGERY